MKKLISVLALTLALFSAHPTFASVRVYNSSGTNIGTYSDLKFANDQLQACIESRNTVVDELHRVKEMEAKAIGALQAVQADSDFVSLDEFAQAFVKDTLTEAQRREIDAPT